MTLRRFTPALVLVILAPRVAPAATYETANFTVEAPTAAADRLLNCRCSRASRPR